MEECLIIIKQTDLATSKEKMNLVLCLCKPEILPTEQL